MVFRRLRCLGTRHPKHEAASIGVSQPPPPQTRTPCGELGLGLGTRPWWGAQGPPWGAGRAPRGQRGRVVCGRLAPGPRGRQVCRALPASTRRASCLPRGSRPRRRRPLASAPVTAHGARGAPTPGDAHARLFPSLAPAPAGGLALAEGASVPLTRRSRGFPRGSAWGPRHRPAELGEAFPGLACGVPSARPFLQGRLLCDSARGGDRLCPSVPGGRRVHGALPAPSPGHV